MEGAGEAEVVGVEVGPVTLKATELSPVTFPLESSPTAPKTWYPGVVFGTVMVTEKLGPVAVAIGAAVVLSMRICTGPLANREPMKVTGVPGAPLDAVI